MTGATCGQRKLEGFVRVYKITDSKQFAHDVIQELTRQEEDGSTSLTMLFDKACIDAVGNGSTAVEDILEER